VITSIVFTSALLIHQLAIFFLPAAVFAIYVQDPHRSPNRWDRVRTACAFTLISGIGTLVVYAAAFLSVPRPSSFLAWITTRASDAQFSFHLFKNILISVSNWIQLFFIGRPSLVDYSELSALILIAICAMALLLWMRAVRRTVPWHFQIYQPVLFRFAATWFIVYAIFLLFWLPNNTFYKLFALPAIILAIASCILPKISWSAFSVFPVFVVFLGSFNLVFGIVPYSRLSANPAVEFAVRLNQVMRSGDWVYYSNFNTDDWLACYFNPQTRWEPLPAGPIIDDRLKKGAVIWLDTTAIDSLSKSSPGWLKNRTRNTDRRNLVNEKHHIEFWRLSPAP
jgi:hypothetical protein